MTQKNLAVLGIEGQNRRIRFSQEFLNTWVTRFWDYDGCTSLRCHIPYRKVFLLNILTISFLFTPNALDTLHDCFPFCSTTPQPGASHVQSLIWLRYSIVPGSSLPCLKSMVHCSNVHCPIGLATLRKQCSQTFSVNWTELCTVHCLVIPFWRAYLESTVNTVTVTVHHFWCTTTNFKSRIQAKGISVTHLWTQTHVTPVFWPNLL